MHIVFNLLSFNSISRGSLPDSTRRSDSGTQVWIRFHALPHPSLHRHQRHSIRAHLLSPLFVTMAEGFDLQPLLPAYRRVCRWIFWSDLLLADGGELCR